MTAADNTVRPGRAKVKFSLISSLHCVRLTYRGLLFLSALLVCILNPELWHASFYDKAAEFPMILAVIWVVLTFDMVVRFFPTKLESMGCQKQFARNFKPSNKAKVNFKRMNRGVGKVALSWILLNGTIGFLYFQDLITDAVLVLIALFYSVCDLICILFFCPFQTWMMKNRCCSTCRIYNWDYLMMTTPLIFIRSLFTWSLVAMALALFLRWEITAYLHPERFYESTNNSLRCANCPEKLCHHKKQLHTFWQKEGIWIQQKIKEL